MNMFYEICDHMDLQEEIPYEWDEGSGKPNLCGRCENKMASTSDYGGMCTRKVCADWVCGEFGRHVGNNVATGNWGCAECIKAPEDYVVAYACPKGVKPNEDYSNCSKEDAKRSCSQNVEPWRGAKWGKPPYKNNAKCYLRNPPTPTKPPEYSCEQLPTKDCPSPYKWRCPGFVERCTGDDGNGWKVDFVNTGYGKFKCKNKVSGPNGVNYATDYGKPDGFTCSNKKDPSEATESEMTTQGNIYNCYYNCEKDLS
jgi:hypothetical protein